MKRVLAYGFGALLLFGGWMTLFVHEIHKVEPKGQTVADHLATMPEPRDIRLVTIHGCECLAIDGPIRSLVTLPSDGPVYLFEKSGALVDWTPDIGEGNFHEEWPGVYGGGRSITREEALRWPVAGK